LRETVLFTSRGDSFVIAQFCLIFREATTLKFVFEGGTERKRGGEREREGGRERERDN